MDLKIAEKRALVIGASSGLGYAIAAELVREGAIVTICSRDSGRIRKAAETMGAKYSITCDVSMPQGGRDAVVQAIAAMGGIDILVTNTGGPPKGPFLSLTPEAWQEGFDSLWRSACESMRAAIPSMQARKWGRILLVTSAAAKEPMPGMNVSNGLRAGLLGLTKSVSNEVAADGITVNALLPGYTRTERLNELKVSESQLTALIPARRLGEPSELAAVAAFLASERASYVSGQMIAVDGGYLHGI